MRNGFLKQLITLLILSVSLSAIAAEKKAEAKTAPDSKQMEIPLPSTLTQYFESNPESSLELVIEIDRMESKQDAALASLFKRTQELGEGHALSAADFFDLETSFREELEQKMKDHQNPYIEIEGQRLYADFLLRLALAAMPDKEISKTLMEKSAAYVQTVREELQKRGSEWIERETPQILSRLAVTEFSLLNIKRLLTNMNRPQFLIESRKISESILEMRPREISELEILSAHVESILYSQDSDPMAPKSDLYLTIEYQAHYRETLQRLEKLADSQARKKHGGIRRLLAIEKAKTILKITSVYLAPASQYGEIFKKLTDDLTSHIALERRTAKDALHYLYSVNEMTGLTLPVAKALGKEAEAKALIASFEEQFVKNMGKEFYGKSLWPSFENVFASLDPTTNINGTYTQWALGEYISSIYRLSTTFLQSKKDPKSVNSSDLEKTLEQADRSWAYLQCSFVFNGIDRFNNQLSVRSPLTKMKFNLNICRSNGNQRQFISSLASKLQTDQIVRARNLEYTLIGVGFTIDVALAITTVGAGNAVKKGLQKASLGAFKTITRRLVASAAGKVAMKITQRLALAVVADIIVSSGKGVKSFTFEALRGRIDVDNLKDNPYFDRDIGPAKHMARLVATSLAGYGLDRSWRALSATGLKRFIEPENAIAKLFAAYGVTTVNSTISKLSAAVADLPFEGQAALSKVPEIFTFDNLVTGSIQSVAMGQLKETAKGFSSSGLSTRFMIRMSDRRMSSDDNSAMDATMRTAH